MKKILLIAVVLIMAISFNSCSDDNDDVQSPDNIIGKWRVSELVIVGLDPIIVENLDLQLNECEKKMTIEIFENGNYTEKDYEYNESLTECILYYVSNGTWEYLGNSMYNFSGLNSEPIKVTFDGNKIIAEYTEIYEGISATLKLIFIDDEDVVPDPIIGNWKLVQEFENGAEVELSTCDLMETFEFLEDGFFLETEFEDDETSNDCIESEVKTRIWKNIGNSTYILYKIDDESEQEVKITFGNNTMTVELTIDEEGVVYSARLIFNRAT